GALEHDPAVAYVAPDRPVQLLDANSSAAPPAVPTGVSRIGAAPALNADGTMATTTAGPAKKAAVALLDTGVMSRPDLNVVGGYDCAPASSGGLLGGLLGGGGSGNGDNGNGGAAGIPTDENGHGTH